MRTFYLPGVDLRRLSAGAAAALVDSTACFITAYSRQLQTLSLRVYAHDCAGRLLACVLQCSQLQRLTVSGGDQRGYRELAEADEYVEQLAPSVASLPPLRWLESLQMSGLYVSVPALTEFLSHCPAATAVELRDIYPYPPSALIQVPALRSMKIQHKRNTQREY